MIQQIWTPNKRETQRDNSRILPHILLVVDQFSKSLGGGERIVLRMARLLPSYGYRVSILTFLWDPETPAVAEMLACPIYLLPLRSTYDLNSLKAAFAFRGFLRNQDIQIVQTFFESSDLWAGLVVKASSHAKLIWSRRDMGILRSFKHRAVYRFLARLPDRVFAVSEQVRKHCIEIDGVSPDRVETIHNGLNLSQPERLHLAPKNAASPSITTVGNIRRVKGHDVFVRAAAQVIARCPTASFSIVGGVLDLEYFRELQALVTELGLSDHFHFKGATAHVSDHLRSASIFVLPSRSEGFSNAIVEAMAESLPVVATDVGGNAEAVATGLTGFIVPPDDVLAMAEAITTLCLEPQTALRMGDAGRKRAEELFSEEAMMRRIQSAYERLLSSDQHSSRGNIRPTI